MKVLLINGSRRANGCTNAALETVAAALHGAGIETELFFVGERAVNGELDELVHEAAAAAKTADGLIVGSPVYYASPTGEVMAFLDRFFGAAGPGLRWKPGAAIASARRGGTTATVDVLNKYFMINQMPLVSSNYWNFVYGNTPEEVLQDAEGLQTMRLLGANMAWLLKSIEAGKEAGVPQPAGEVKVRTNFVRG